MSLNGMPQAINTMLTSFHVRERRRLPRIGFYKPPRFTMLRATSCHDAVRMRRTRCAPRSNTHTYLARHAGNAKQTETRTYGSTPSGRRRRLGAPWLPLRITLRCLPAKRYELCCGVYTPMLYGYAAVSTHQSSTQYAEVTSPKMQTRRRGC